MGIEVLDHVIIGDHQFISLKKKGTCDTITFFANPL